MLGNPEDIPLEMHRRGYISDDLLKKGIYSVKIKTWVLITGKMKWTPFCAVKDMETSQL